MTRLKIVFFGTPDFAVPSLEALAGRGQEIVQVIAQPDRPAGRGMSLRPPSVAVAARLWRLPLTQPSKIRTEEFLSVIRALKPDLGVVVAYGRILPESLLSIPGFGFLNVHASLLPRHRGAAPIQRSIESGDTTTGVTIMGVDAELDHGPSYGMRETAIGPDERAPQLSARLATLGAELLVEVIAALPSITPRPQEHANATYAAKLEKEEGEVHWEWPARRIYDRFRAFDPWPGLFTHHEGLQLKLREIAPEAGSGLPGTILQIDEKGIVVATGDSALRLKRVQLPGRNGVSGAEYARSAGLRAGDRLS